MWKVITGFVAAVLAASSCLAADLTEIEVRWLKGVWPVVVFAHTAKLPLDIIVQPQATPGAAPLALGFIDGRCKLVLSMRGNSEAQATLDRIEPDLLDATLELMAAHELGHCHRYLEGSWLSLPAGFAASEPAGLSANLRESYRNMKAVRLEEGYADLVGLAWARQHHRQKHQRLLTWLIAERSRDLIPGSHHDTLAWIQMAGDGNALIRPSIFAAAAALWDAGLAAADPWSEP
ncbi:MAG: hypothetical protein IH627_00920 [Rubrivivax sp.]|nr:hypothetical protein [Rubrivivax sp.]